MFATPTRALPQPPYTAAPLAPPAGPYKHIRARKIAPGLLEAQNGDRLQLTKTGIGALTVHSISMGRVKVGVDPKTGLAYAVKKYRLNDARLSNKMRFSKARTAAYLVEKLAGEARLGAVVGSPVAISKLWVTDKHVYGQMALMDGDMEAAKRQRLWTQQASALTAPTPALRQALRSVLLDLAGMHGRGYAHCDIKPANIMHRTTPSSAHLADFTMVRRLGDRTAAQGTPRHMAPEQASAKSGGFSLRDWAAADVWAVGLSFLEMLVGNPFDTESIERTRRLQAYANWHHWKLRGGSVGKVRAHMTPYAKDFKATLWSLDPPWRDFFMTLMHPVPEQRGSAQNALRILDAIP